MTPKKEELAELLGRIQRLESQLKRQRRAGGATLLLTILAIATGFVASNSAYLRVRGITVVDETGKARILIGAPTDNYGRTRKDAATASLVVLGPNGQDRLTLGENPNPRINGKTYPRIAASYGLTIHDVSGQERGGVAFLDNGRGVIALDRPNQDAVELIVNDKTGFAGLTMNFERPFGQYKEAVRIGTKGQEVWWALSDTSSRERASVHVKDAHAPLLELRDAEGK